MSTGTANLHARAPRVSSGSLATRLRDYFFSDSRRSLQTVVGLIWLLDGGLQFQSFMYSHGFIEMLTGMTPGQPGWISGSVNWAAHTAEHHLDVYNTLFALVQCFIGLGLLYRRTVKPALAVSFAWALVVWWFGEAFGMMFMSMASPLTGAPGAVLLYALIGLIVWPNDRPGGLLGVRGARTAWATLWLVMAWLWLEAPSSNASAISQSIKAAPSGMSWLSSLQEWLAKGLHGNGVALAIVLGLISAAIGIAVAANWRPKTLLTIAIVLNLVFWVVGQGFGGIFEGGATDPNAGLLFIVLAAALWWLIPYGHQPNPATSRPATSHA
ncbi:MAG: hypothetical protein WB698_11250 [Solirubrobacteraceae bacterium]